MKPDDKCLGAGALVLSVIMIYRIEPYTAVTMAIVLLWLAYVAGMSQRDR